MNSLDAVAEALRRAGNPLHYHDITQLMLESGLWTTEGKTPDAMRKDLEGLGIVMAR